MKAKHVLLTMAVVLGLSITLGLAQSVPQLINYQGRLTDSAGVPINTTVPMHFALLDGDTMTATVLWGETQSLVQVNQGIYNVMLGSVTPIPGSALDGATVFLEVRVSGETLRPRQRVTSAAYALKARDAILLNGQPSSQYANSTHDHNPVYYTQAQVDAMIAALQSNLQAQITALQTQHNADVSSLDTRTTTNEAQIGTLQTDVTDHEARISTTETKLAPVSVASNDFIFTGVNIYVQDAGWKWGHGGRGQRPG